MKKIKGQAIKTLLLLSCLIILLAGCSSKNTGSDVTSNSSTQKTNKKKADELILIDKVKQYGDEGFTELGANVQILDIIEKDNQVKVYYVYWMEANRTPDIIKGRNGAEIPKAYYYMSIAEDGEWIEKDRPLLSADFKELYANQEIKEYVEKYMERWKSNSLLWGTGISTYVFNEKIYVRLHDNGKTYFAQMDEIGNIVDIQCIGEDINSNIILANSDKGRGIIFKYNDEEKYNFAIGAEILDISINSSSLPGGNRASVMANFVYLDLEEGFMLASDDAKDKKIQMINIHTGERLYDEDGQYGGLKTSEKSIGMGIGGGQYLVAPFDEYTSLQSLAVYDKQLNKVSDNVIEFTGLPSYSELVLTEKEIHVWNQVLFKDQVSLELIRIEKWQN